MDHVKVFRNVPSRYNTNEKKRTILQLVTNEMPVKRKQQIFSAQCYLPCERKTTSDLSVSNILVPAFAIVNVDNVGLFGFTLKVSLEMLAIILMHDGYGFVSSDGPHLFTTLWDVAFYRHVPVYSVHLEHPRNVLRKLVILSINVSQKIQTFKCIFLFYRPS